MLKCINDKKITIIIKNNSEIAILKTRATGINKYKISIKKMGLFLIRFIKTLYKIIIN